MKIGLITFHLSNNYGAILQTYALQTVLQNSGHNVEIINYSPPARRSKDKLIGPLPKYNHKSSGLRYAAGIIYNFFMDLLNLSQKKHRRSYFHRFYAKYLQLSNQQYNSYEELLLAPPLYDFYLIGSDQVWNPHNTGGRLDPAYFLAFAGKNKGRSSYASSLGGFDPTNSTEFKNLIQNVNRISVRESSSVPLIEAISGQKVTCVLDPTLLLTAGEWENIALAPAKIHSDFILVYQLGNNKVHNLAKQVAAHLHLPIKYIRYNTYPLKYKASFVKIEEYVWLFSHASFVITDSFHGTAFSIIHKKPFYTIQNKGNHKRVLDLLTSLGISDRLFINDAHIDNVDTYIDYDSVYEKLNLLRAASFQYLDDILQLSQEKI